MKKGSWAAVAVAISATLALGCAGSAWAKDFSDVDYQGGWYVSAVEYVSDKGYMTGYDGSSEFGVGKTLTRGELACLLYKRAGEPSSSKAENLTGMRDIDSPSWYTAAANWAAENKVVTGVDTASGKQFQPNEPVTREMMATILWRLSGSPDAGSSALEAIDGHDAVDAWALPAMRWAAEAGVLTGVDTASGKDLQAVRAVLREEAAAMIERYDGLSSGGGAVTPAPDPGDNQGGATDPSTPGTGGGSTGGSTEPSNPGGGSAGGTTEPTNPDPTPSDPAKQDQSAPAIHDFYAGSNLIRIDVGSEYLGPLEYSVDGSSTWVPANRTAADTGETLANFWIDKLQPNTEYNVLVRKPANQTHNASPAASKVIWTSVEKGSADALNFESGAYSISYDGGSFFDGANYVDSPVGRVVHDRNGRINNKLGFQISWKFKHPSPGPGTGALEATAYGNGAHGTLSIPVEYPEEYRFFAHTFVCERCYAATKSYSGSVVKDGDGHPLATYNVLDPKLFPSGVLVADDFLYTFNGSTLEVMNNRSYPLLEGRLTPTGVKLVTANELECSRCHNKTDFLTYNQESDAVDNEYKWTSTVATWYVTPNGEIKGEPND